MSLIPTDYLSVMLVSVTIQLSIPMTDISSYYDSLFIDDSISVPGLLLTLNIPLASRQTAFTLFEAKPIPIPCPDALQSALESSIEAQYLAIPEDQMESSVSFSDHFEHCLGSSKYRIFSETFPTKIGHFSWIVTLCLDSSVDALSVCDTSLASSPSTQQAANLGFGIWLITSASDYFIVRETYATTSSYKTQSSTSCRICIIILERCMQIKTNKIKIRSDLHSCFQFPAIKFRVSLPHPLASLIMQVPL